MVGEEWYLASSGPWDDWRVCFAFCCFSLDKCAFVATCPGVRWEGSPPWPIMSGPITYGGRFVAPEGGDQLCITPCIRR